MNTITLAGWGQPHDALCHLAAGATAIDYAHASSAEEAIRMIAMMGKDAARVIGWSLGGQLAVRAIASGAIRPQQLVLIATPYQFVDDTALGRDTFSKFHGNYQNNPRRTLDKAWELIHYEDARAPYIRDQLSLFSKDTVLQKDWLRWLNLLSDFSCDVLDFTDFPPTLLIHGERDKVVDVAQSERFSARIRQATLERWRDCGHAPHWHDADRLRQSMEAHAHV